MYGIDWVKIWENCRKRSSWTKHANSRRDSWEGLAEVYGKSVVSTGYPGTTLKVINKLSHINRR